MVKYVDLKQYHKYFGGFGITSILGFLTYEAYKINSALSSLIKTNVLDVDRKRPDYIYIKHHIYRHSLQKKLKEKENRGFVNIIIQPFGKWWKAIKHSIAWRLLQVAQTGDQSERIKAVRQLALIDHLKDWDFQHLAQQCHPRTAISLARSNCDRRWFLPPKEYGVYKSHRDVLNEVKSLLEKLIPNKCVQFALDQVFGAEQIKEPPEGDGHSYSITTYEHDSMKQLVDALLHLTTNQAICEKIVEIGGLFTLVEIEKLYKDNIEMKLCLSRIIANISVCSQFVYDFFVTGWIGILVKWQTDLDMRVQVTSALALSNLDTDDPNSFKYAPKVYPLHPRSRRKNQPHLDVIFIHGLLGGVFVTWRQKDLKPESASLLGKKSAMPTPKSPKKTRQTLQSKHDKKFHNSFNKKEGLTSNHEELIPMRKQHPDAIQPNIADTQTQEIIKALTQDESPVGSDWSVVFPDVPLKAEESNSGPYQIAGDKWSNSTDEDEDYTFCWPMEWLPKDFPNIRVIGINYESSLSQWSNCGCPCEKENGKLEKRATEFLERLVKSKVGQDRPVVWVGHSMGGLLIKSIIVQALQSDDENVRKLGLNTQGVMFLGTPHKGSTLAKLRQHTSALFWPSVEVMDLKENSKSLLKLNEQFLNFIKYCKKPVEIVSICEGTPTTLTSFKFPLQIVSEDSARIGTGDFYVTNDNHLGISKPICRHSFLYQRLVRVIDNALAQNCVKLDPKNEEEEADVSTIETNYFKQFWNIIIKDLEKVFQIVI